MAAPNVVNVATITAKTAVQLVLNSHASIVTNASSSSKVFKVNALYISNVDGTSSADVDVSVLRGGVYYHIAKTVSVPADSTLDVLSKSVYLEEGDALCTLASAASDLEAVCSYEEIS